MRADQAVLVVAEQPFRDALVALVRTNGYEALTCRTPLEAIHALERCGPTIGYVVLSPSAPRALELRTLLADEYPGVQPLILSS